MNKIIKIFVYCMGIGLVIGLGIWTELNSGEYSNLEKKNGKVSAKQVINKKVRN